MTTTPTTAIQPDTPPGSPLLARSIDKLALYAVIAVWLVPLSASISWSAEQTPPNIVFVFSDDHAYQAISAYGSRVNETPNIDRLANEGAIFRNSFCANSLCGPSRACILTGKHSHINGFLRNGNLFDAGQMTFPKLLQQVGYQTAVIGKWHLSSNPVGFDYWQILPGQGSYYNPDFIKMDGSRTRYQGYCTDVITFLSRQWLNGMRDKSKPFLLMCQHKAPHRNWAPAERHFSLYADEDIPEPETLRDDYANRSSLLKENEMSLKDHFHWGHDAKFHGENLFPDYFAGKHKNGEYNRMTDAQKAAWDAHYEPENQEFIAQIRNGEIGPDEILSWKYQRYIKDYLRCIAAVDDSVKVLLDTIDELGIADNTIFIYSSDQGFYLGEHGWYDKRWMFEESLQMPFLVRWPGKLKPGSEPTALIQNIDYAPTFLELAGATIPEEIQGRSFASILRGEGEPDDWRDAIYYAYYENASVHNVPVQDGIRTHDFKLMYFPRTREWQLFDLKNDPQEMKSVHNDPAYAAVMKTMKNRYDELREQYDVNTATIPATRGDESWWKERDQKAKARIKRGNVDLAFIGDSITQSWEGPGKSIWKQYYEPRNPVNLGFSGDRTEHVIWRLTHGQLDGIEPQVAVVMIGTNNTGHLMQDPGEVAAGVERILNIIRARSPKTKIVLHGVFPRGRTPDAADRKNNQQINELIAGYADGENIRFLDIGEVFLDDDGNLPEDLAPDALHLNEAGYKLWAEALEPTLEELGL